MIGIVKSTVQTEIELPEFFSADDLYYIHIFGNVRLKIFMTSSHTNIDQDDIIWNPEHDKIVPITKEEFYLKYSEALNRLLPLQALDNESNGGES